VRVSNGNRLGGGNASGRRVGGGSSGGGSSNDRGSRNRAQDNESSWSDNWSAVYNMMGGTNNGERGSGVNRDMRFNQHFPGVFGGQGYRLGQEGQSRGS